MLKSLCRVEGSGTQKIPSKPVVRVQPFRWHRKEPPFLNARLGFFGPSVPQQHARKVAEQTDC